MIEIVNPVRQFRLENCIWRTLSWIARDEVNISWAKAELEWLEQNPNVAPEAWLTERRQWAEELLAEYEEDLQKDKKHLEELKQLLQIEKPLS
jgi:septal ring factor EnvC (AmiA/AmiB activator)